MHRAGIADRFNILAIPNPGPSSDMGLARTETMFCLSNSLARLGVDRVKPCLLAWVREVLIFDLRAEGLIIQAHSLKLASLIHSIFSVISIWNLNVFHHI